MYNSLHLLIPNSQSIPPPTPSPLATTSLFSMSMILKCTYSWVLSTPGLGDIWGPLRSVTEWLCLGSPGRLMSKAPRLGPTNPPTWAWGTWAGEWWSRPHPALLRPSLLSGRQACLVSGSCSLFSHGHQRVVAVPGDFSAKLVCDSAKEVYWKVAVTLFLQRSHLGHCRVTQPSLPDTPHRQEVADYLSQELHPYPGGRASVDESWSSSQLVFTYTHTQIHTHTHAHERGLWSLWEVTYELISLLQITTHSPISPHRFLSHHTLSYFPTQVLISQKGNLSLDLVF